MYDFFWRTNITQPTVTLFESYDYYHYQATWRSYVVWPSTEAAAIAQWL